MKMLVCNLIAISLWLLLPAPAIGFGSERTAVTLKTDSSSKADEELMRNRPVAAVVALLHDMTKELKKEAIEDEDTYDKYNCWCITVSKEKMDAIKETQNRIAQINVRFEVELARQTELQTRINHLTEEKTAAEQSLATAQSLRDAQAAEFALVEQDMLSSITALKQAGYLLGKHQSLSQVTSAVATLQQELQKHTALLQRMLTPEQHKAFTSFLQTHTGDYWDAAPTMQDASYRAESGQIFGVLSQLRESFEQNLDTARKTESKRTREFFDLRVAKNREIAILTTQLLRLNEQKTSIDVEVGLSTTDNRAEHTNLNEDEAFLMDLKKRCGENDVAWKKRQKTRTAEMLSVSQAITILDADESFHTFDRTFNPTFFQKSSTVQWSRRTQAAKLLRAVSQEVGDSGLQKVVRSVRIDDFPQVKKMIDTLVVDLEKAQVEEQQLKVFCDNALTENMDDSIDTARKLNEVEVANGEMVNTISGMKSEIAGWEGDIAQFQDNLAAAAKTRKEEHAEFELTVADQRATQKLVSDALTALEAFYEDAQSRDRAHDAHQYFLQRDDQAQPADDASPPPTFEAYAKQDAKGTNGAVTLLRDIKEQAKQMETSTMAAEKAAQDSYETLVEETEEDVLNRQRLIISKKPDLAKEEERKAASDKEIYETSFELDKLKNTKFSLHQECDFMINNYGLRQEARAKEISGLKQAKVYISGGR